MLVERGDGEGTGHESKVEKMRIKMFQKLKTLFLSPNIQILQ